MDAQPRARPQQGSGTGQPYDLFRDKKRTECSAIKAYFVNRTRKESNPPTQARKIGEGEKVSGLDFSSLRCESARSLRAQGKKSPPVFIMTRTPKSRALAVLARLFWDGSPLLVDLVWG